MWKRLVFFLVLAVAFAFAWRVLDRVALDVVGQPSQTGMIQNTLERPFFENLAASTGLPLEVTYRALDTVGIKDTYQLRLIEDGRLPLVSLRFLQNALTEPTLLGIDPLGFTTDFATAREVVQAYLPVLQRRLAENFGARLLGVWPFGPQVFFCRVPIRGIADLAGLRIRVGNDNFAPMITALGGVPAVIAFEEVKDALAKGLVDCAISSAGSAHYAGWAAHATHYFPLGTQMGINGYVISLRVWERLSARQQNLLQQAFDQHVDAIWAFSRELHDDASSCLVGGPCKTGVPFRLQEVVPGAADYQRMHAMFEQTTFKDWADRCDRLYPGCSQDWRRRMAPILQRRAAGMP